ncbi:MAG TPA: hypothetical protein VH120_16800 [Gemmataceae bacterium]|nr:hypothetical protein [Gemmataceae bacterium]
MSTIMVDQAMKAALSGVTDVAEMRDADGNVLGVFAPGASSEEARLYLHAWMTLDPEQVRKQKQATEKT